MKSGDSAQFPTLAFEYLYGNPVSRVVQRARVESGQSELLETDHLYDGLGRNVRSVLPDGSASERRYAPLATEHWDAEDLDPASAHTGTPRTERLNALGVAEVEERLGAEKHLTQFQRDALGRVTQVTDAVGQVSTWHFDGLGRAGEIVHTDAGQIRLSFDDAGNLLSRRDARGALVATDVVALHRWRVVERLL